ncbi:MAG: nuclear transport factor 2 family protein [Novosphingobium sp.]
MTDISRRVSRLEDRVELEELVVRYFLASDGDDLETIRRTFSNEATFAVSGHVVGTGPDGIVDFIVEQRANMGLTLHTPNYGLFSFESDDRARGLVGAHLELVLGGQSTFGAVRYEDEYVRGAGGWQIRSRDMRTIHIAPWAEVAEAFASETPQRWPGIAPGPSDFPRKRSA